MEIGEKIKASRQKKQMSREELAKKVGLSKFAIIKYEQGQRIPKVDILLKIAKALDIPSHEFATFIDSNLSLNDYLELQIPKINKDITEGFNKILNVSENTDSSIYNTSKLICTNIPFKETLLDLVNTESFQNEFNINTSKLTLTEKQSLSEEIYKYIDLLCYKIKKDK
ncbi:MAG: helix-turn-helix transcriptional regulator [Clostridium sp.]|uniref:helix-turn-helix domain-containing protein n=1 Tax=Clostridium sp. TaxID=1506 RepID=UPI0025C37CA8|nr:helix-turn-helix transcriptional regulator [Clostridium sp.]MBS5927552.1 helix-turn-helix transcriptional regulator [Clostridium sp.]